MMKTATGFEYEVNQKALNNMELLDAFADLQASENDITAMVRIINLLLGKEAKARLYDHVREEDGRVPVEKVSQELAEIFSKLGEEAKKLSSSQG